MTLSNHKKKRYSRQILLNNIDTKGQEVLNKATICIIGLGALGTTIANNLARAGIGNLRLVDRDIVELENLHRQILYDEQMLGEPKAKAAAEYLKNINSDIKIDSFVKDVNFSTIQHIVGKSDLILDGTDNLETRFLINDLSIKNNIPWIYAGVVGTQGMTMNIIPDKKSKNPCFRCLIVESPGAGSLPTCDTYGILNTVPPIMGSIQSSEAIKILLGDKNINRKLIYYDVWSHEFRALEILKNPSCKTCGKNDYEYLNVKKRSMVTSLCGQNSVQIVPIKSSETSIDDFAKKLGRIGKVKKTELSLDFFIDKFKITLFSDGRAIIKGTSDDNLAKSLYTKYIGN
jgi:adenylyltransferase/sulfurtransferase